jgi:hypothetical protein
MELLIFISILVIAYIVFSGIGNDSGSKHSQNVESRSSGYSENFLPPLPKGFRIYESYLSVAGIQKRKEELHRFAHGSDQSLELIREPSNAYDTNAIKVIGNSSGMQSFIGYVPKDTAEQVIKSGLFEIVKPRLSRIYVGTNGFADVQFQIIGPKEMKKQYDDVLNAKPATNWQKKFYKTFDLPISKGLTTGEAEKTIAEHRKKLEFENKAKLDEWDAIEDEEEAFEEIREEFDNADFRAGYNIKKVNLSLLKEAVGQLQKEGKSNRHLVDNIDLVYEKVIKLKPDLQKEY